MEDIKLDALNTTKHTLKNNFFIGIQLDKMFLKVKKGYLDCKNVTEEKKALFLKKKTTLKGSLRNQKKQMVLLWHPCENPLLEPLLAQ